MTTASTETLRAIALTELKVSPTAQQAERRRHFDKTAIEELADSLKSVTQLQPILVRPVAGHFEIVAGERRFLAAKKAGLPALDATVKDFTDEQVLEIQLIENLQREGLNELAEAEGYEALHREHGHSADSIAEKVGKSKAYVYARMKLLALSKDSRTAFRDGKISASIALLIARIQSEDDQAKALEHILEPHSWSSEPLSYRDAQAYVQENFMLKLSQAPFPRDDAELVPAAGTCGACPKRTGNQPELFGDVKSGDVCTDPVCFKAKRAAYITRELEKAKASGKDIVRGGTAKKAHQGYRYSTLNGKELNGFVRPSDKCEADPKKRTYAQLLGKSVEAVLLQNPESGKYSNAYRMEDVRAALKEHKIKLPEQAAPEARSANDARWKAEQARRELADKIRLETICEIVRRASPKLERPALEAIFIGLTDVNGFGDCDGIWAAAGLSPMKRGQHRKEVAKISDSALIRIIYGFALEGVTYNDTKALDEPVKRLKIDVAAIKAKLATPAPEKPAAKRKASKRKAK